jgi:hypothetical protein
LALAIEPVRAVSGNIYRLSFFNNLEEVVMDREKRLEMGVERDLGCDCIDVSQDDSNLKV